MSERVREPLEKRPGESLTEYIARLELLSGTQRIRIHPDYIDKEGSLLVKPVVSYAVADDASVHPFVSTGGTQPLLDEDHVFTAVNATVATQAVIQPASPKILYLYGIWVAQGATAAGRDWTPTITDGTTGMPMATTVNIASSATARIWPQKEADSLGITYSPFPISNEYYLELVDTMAAAEAAIVRVVYVQRSNES